MVLVNVSITTAMDFVTYPRFLLHGQVLCRVDNCVVFSKVLDPCSAGHIRHSTNPAHSSLVPRFDKGSFFRRSAAKIGI